MKYLRRAFWVVATAIVALFVLLVYWSFCCVHQHCIQATAMSLLGYANDHEGKYPSSPKGFGNALLTLIKDGYFETPTNIVGPDDDGHVYREALASGQDVDERLCTRIYVQGLTNKVEGRIAILFDRDGCPGGDHFRKLWGPKVREVIYSNGAGLDTIPDERWAAFAKAQVRLLVANGIPKETAQSYYLLTGVSTEELEGE